MLKPKIFIGSSSEGKDVARAFVRALKDIADVVPWWSAPEFQPMHGTLDGLENAADFYDFAIIILSPDDKIESRGVKNMSTRDNVLFEFGLFLGSIGRDRVFPFIQESESKRKKVKLPSDLLGLTIPTFTNLDEHNLIASVNAAADDIRPKILERGRIPPQIDLLSGYSFDKRKKAFSMTLSAVKLERFKNKLKGRKLLLVARKDGEGDFADDRNVVFSPVLKPPTLAKDLVLTARSTRIFKAVRKGVYVEGHLLLLPEKLRIAKIRTVAKLREKGGDLLTSRATRVR
jgi:predicted nucleotide-binding protein with TIR-like domain